MSSAITLAKTMTFAQANTFGRPMNSYAGNEPAITAANIVKQTFIGPPFVWPWNRKVVTFNTVVGQQDYPLSVPTFGWVESASVQDTTVSPSKWNQLENKISLELDSSTARPVSIAAQLDDGNGNITFRLMPLPDAVYPVSITIQQTPATFTAPSDLWAPIPDRYQYIFSWGFLSMMYLFADDPRFGACNQKFIAALLAANQGLTQTQVNIFLNNWAALTGDLIVRQANIQQGHTARGI
jgi:hypothetical protein